MVFGIYLKPCMRQYEGEFKLIKFQTMYRDREHELPELLKQNGHQGNGKPAHDPRIISGFHKVIRTYHIDDFLNLINWMKGDVKPIGLRAQSEERWLQYGFTPEEIKRLKKYKPSIIPVNKADDRLFSNSNYREFCLKYLDEYDKDPFGTDKKMLKKIFGNAKNGNMKSA